jgi:phospholipid/cholesterol/gamma-HCH transport system substrate-binding protein
MSRDRQLLLGVFFLVVFLILAGYTLMFSDFSLFREQHYMTVFFPDANGLRRGDTVLVAGIREGKVRELTYDPGAEITKRITVKLVLDHAVELREGKDIYIEESTVLGGKDVYINPGPANGAVLSSDAVLFGRVKGGALDGLGRLVDANGDRVAKILDDLGGFASDLKQGKGVIGRLASDEKLADDFTETLASAKASAANIESISNDIKAGKGVIGRLVTDEDFAKKLQQIGDDLAAITSDFKGVTADMQAGKGVLGRLSKDEQLADDVQAAVTSLREITNRINAANGTFWRFMEDDTLAKKLETLLDNTENGTLGKLLNSPELYDKLSKIADDVSAATEAIRSQQGTLGKLVMDQSLYNEISKALAILTRTLEEYREAAPITTFTSVLFGAF